ncbi:MAG: small multi-drug export protein [Desulfuromonadales bacterium]|nr:small multi-drug export protein [Desulfuromonadales bacterium]
MLADLWQALAGIPAEATTVLVAALPISEVRGASPYAMALGDLSWPTAFVFAVIGNAIPVAPLLLGLEPVSNWLRRWRVWDRFFTWLFARTRRRGKMVERYEALGLLLFVSIPLPVTGAWTGCVAAFIFGIRPRLAFPMVLCGILIAATVVTLATMGVIGGVELFTR